MRKAFDLSVYFVADPGVCGGRDVADVVAAALRGGVSMVQLRDKENATTSEDVVRQNALKIKAVIDSYNRETGSVVPFLINDHVDIAYEIGADGVHIGQDDMSPQEARKILGDEAIVGLTAYTEEQIKAIDPRVVDYIGTGPFYATKTDKGKEVLGAEKFAELIKLSPVPVVGIGGITPDNAAAVIEAGAQGVAMMRSVSEASDSQEAAYQFSVILSAVKPKGERSRKIS